jgi:hypothetical protein
MENQVQECVDNSQGIVFPLRAVPDRQHHPIASCLHQYTCNLGCTAVFALTYTQGDQVWRP